MVVISIVDKIKFTPRYLPVADIPDREHQCEKVPVGAMAFIRSDWAKSCSDTRLASAWVFPGVSLATLQFLHGQRRILFTGHELLDTDTTPDLEGEAWWLHHGYVQVEGVTHLDRVPETGALILIGFSKFKGGLGGFAQFIVRCVRWIGKTWWRFRTLRRQDLQSHCAGKKITVSRRIKEALNK